LGEGKELAPRDESPAYRVTAPPHPISFTDEFAGPQTFDIDREVGDFVVATKAGLPAYQLAVVVDDARQGVTGIVRGDDLLSSAARQLWLYELLGLTPLPHYYHLPLVLGPDGRRLAKRHGDTRLATYRERGVTAERIIGLLAAWSGAAAAPRPMSAREFAASFSIDRLPHPPVTFTPGDHAWLIGSQKNP
jgi:glutamyl-tRNA synthetase